MSIVIDAQKLAPFLVKAKIATYASGSSEFSVSPILAGSHQLEYTESDLLYRDIYYGGMYFIGMETVFQGEQAIWGMTYYGGVLPESTEPQISGMSPVLKAALREVPLEAPFRGPVSYQLGNYRYENEIKGDLLGFYGHEIIRHQEQAIYQLHYSGGMVE